MDIDLLTSNGLIIYSRYYDFDDTTCIVNISRVFQSGHLRIFRCRIAHLRKNDFGSSLTG